MIIAVALIWDPHVDRSVRYICKI